MSNRIQIRRGGNAPTSSNLLDYELGWDYAHKILYIKNKDTSNNNNTITIEQIGGSGSTLFLPLTGGTLTGNLIISKTTDSTLRLTSTNINLGTGTTTGKLLVQFTGTNSISSNDNLVSFIRSEHINGVSDFTISSRTYQSDGTTKIDNALHLISKRNGTVEVIVGSSASPSSEPNQKKAWCDGIGAVKNFSSNTIEYTSTAGVALPITVQRATDNNKAGVAIRIKNTTSTLMMDLLINTNGQDHGLYSYGYYNGTTYTDTGKWLVKRDSTGAIYVGEHKLEDYLPLTGGTLTGNLTAKTIEISSTTGEAHLKFSRSDSTNYITFPDGGNLAIGPLKSSLNINDMYLLITSGAILPRDGGERNLGNATYKWGTIYANKLILYSTDDATNTTSGTLQVKGGIGCVGNLYVGGTLQTTASANLYNYSGVYAQAIGNSPSFYFKANADSNNYQVMGNIFVASETANSIKVCDKFCFRQYSYNTSTGVTNTDAYDQYFFPSVAGGKTGTSGYGIVTSPSYARRIFVVSTADKPAAAVNGDIVLVKV